MNRRTAEQIVSMLLRAGNEIAATIDIFKADGSEDQVKKYAKAVGDVVYGIDSLLRPIIVEYPDILPDVSPEFEPPI